jgi:hypothetical protein
MAELEIFRIARAAATAVGTSVRVGMKISNISFIEPSRTPC